MYSFVWPPSLPQTPNTNYSESGGVLMLRSPMDAGPAKMRKRGNKAQTINLSFNMTPAQIVTFETFVKTTLNGTARFGFTSPRTGSVIEVRIVPQGSGDLYTIDYMNAQKWNVSFQLEVLP